MNQGKLETLFLVLLGIACRGARAKSASNSGIVGGFIAAVNWTPRTMKTGTISPPVARAD